MIYIINLYHCLSIGRHAVLSTQMASQQDSQMNLNMSKEFLYNDDNKHETIKSPRPASQQKQSQQQSEDSSQLHQQSNAKKRKKKKKKSKAKDRDYLASPDKIVEYVLSKTSFKVPDLSRIVEEKFYASDYVSEIKQELRGLAYNDLVSCYDQRVSVLPENFDEEKNMINLSPSALTSLTCIRQSPEKRFRWKRKMKANKDKKKNDNNQNQTTAQFKRPVRPLARSNAVTGPVGATYEAIAEQSQGPNPKLKSES